MGITIVPDDDMRNTRLQYYFCAGEVIFSVFKVSLEE